MFGFGKNRQVSPRKMRYWAANQKLDKVVALLRSGNIETRCNAVKILSTINMVNVKRELVLSLQDKEESVAMLVVEKLEYMGITPDERKEVEKCRAKWKK